MKIGFQILILIAVFTLGLFLKSGFQKPEALVQSQASKEVREGGKTSLINPLLECEQAESAFVELKPFKQQMQNYVDEVLAQNKAKFISVYFRDLNNGPWFGINEKENFTPASLLKVPLMIAYFKMAEEYPEILNKSIAYTEVSGAVSQNQNFPPSQQLEMGKSYSAEELIERMIIYSDNQAQNLLVNNVDINELSRVYSDFGMNLPNAEHPETQVKIKDYTAFFRMLFNSSYLDRNYSEKALKILAKIDFKEGLAASIPQNILVAHKFGERQKMSEMQLHDCGVVYYPKHPYLLCVMTRGQDMRQLSGVIRDVSKLVFEEINRQYQQ